MPVNNQISKKLVNQLAQMCNCEIYRYCYYNDVWSYENHESQWVSNDALHYNWDKTNIMMLKKGDNEFVLHLGMNLHQALRIEKYENEFNSYEYRFWFANKFVNKDEWLEQVAALINNA